MASLEPAVETASLELGAFTAPVGPSAPKAEVVPIVAAPAATMAANEDAALPANEEATEIEEVLSSPPNVAEEHYLEATVPAAS